MKAITQLAVVCVLAGTACTSSQPTLALAPVGPRRIPPETEIGPRGSLVVYSAFETVNAFSDAEQRRHSDYDLRSVGGELIQRVVNHEQSLGEDPAIVKLVPGRYSITARASNSRRVDVPVVIEAEKTTCVRLDGSEPIGSSRVAASEMVRLPDGTPVGWRAKSPD